MAEIQEVIMDFLKLAEERYSVRSFQDKKLTADVIDKIIKAGHLAPTGCTVNTDLWKKLCFTIVFNEPKSSC